MQRRVIRTPILKPHLSIRWTRPANCVGSSKLQPGEHDSKVDCPRTSPTSFYPSLFPSCSTFTAYSAPAPFTTCSSRKRRGGGEGERRGEEEEEGGRGGRRKATNVCSPQRGFRAPSREVRLVQKQRARNCDTQQDVQVRRKATNFCTTTWLPGTITCKHTVHPTT